MNIGIKPVYGLYVKNRGKFNLPRATHNAPMTPGVAQYILSYGLENGYWKPGDLILDPMAGIATGLAVAMHMGFRVAGIEVEEKHALQARSVLSKTSSYLKNAGPWVALQVPQEALSWSIVHGDCRDILPQFKGTAAAIITSPPYESTLGSGDEGPFASAVYSTIQSQEERERVRQELLAARKDSSYGAYGDSAGQLSLLRGEQFWSALSRVYYLCLEALKPGGWLVTVTKDYIKDGQRIPVNGNNIQSAENAGFVHCETMRAMGAMGGMWKRILNAKYRADGRDDLVIDYEELQFYHKE